MSKIYNLVINKNNLVAVLLCFLTIFGMHSFTGIRALGIMLTPYRVIVPLLLLIYGIKVFQDKKKEILEVSKKTRAIKTFVCVFIMWILYGTAEIILAENIVYEEGLKELYMLILAFMSVIVMVVLSLYEVKAEVFIKTLKVIYVSLLIFAIFETVTGMHLDSSKLCEIDYSQSDLLPFKYLATTIFYNPNDYAAFMAIFLPLFFPYKSYKTYIANLIIIVVSISLLIRLDAWIALFAVVISSILFLVFYKGTSESQSKGFLQRIGVVSSIVASYKWGGFILAGLSNAYIRLEIMLGNTEVSGGNGNLGPTTVKVGEVIISQLGETAGNSSGNMRIETYINSIKNMFVETSGLGYGPSSFSNYLLNSGENATLLDDPHSLWVEILVQYGVIIFILYIGFLLYLYSSLAKIYFKNKSQAVFTAILVDTSFVFAAFAPSTFLTYPYQWMAIGMSLILIVEDRRKSNINRAGEKQL